MSGKLFRPEFDQMETAEKQAMMETLARRYDMTFLGLQTFDRWGQSCTTGVFQREGRAFTFVPGGSATIGFHECATCLSEEVRGDLELLAREWEMNRSPEDLLQERLTDVKHVNIGPMLVARKLEEVGWEPITIDDPRLAARPNVVQEFHDILSNGTADTTLVTMDFARIIRKNGVVHIDLYQDTDYETLLRHLEQQGLSLATADEWAYLCGGGCRTLFPWGNDLDESMHLYHFERPEDRGKPYDMEEPNFFGLSIAYDPYKREVVKGERLTTCGGDGGCNICGGCGLFVGYLPCSPHYKPGVQEHNQLDGMYDFYRPIIRVELA